MSSSSSEASHCHPSVLLPVEVDGASGTANDGDEEAVPESLG